MTDPVEFTDDMEAVRETRPDYTFLAFACVFFIIAWVFAFTEWAL